MTTQEQSSVYRELIEVSEAKRELESQVRRLKHQVELMESKVVDAIECLCGITGSNGNSIGSEVSHGMETWHWPETLSKKERGELARCYRKLNAARNVGEEYEGES